MPLAEAGLVTENANEKTNIEDMVELDVEQDFQIISEEVSEREGAKRPTAQRCAATRGRPRV